MDRYLDQTTTGPHYLRDPRIAKIVEDAILESEAAVRYHLHAYVVMSNHVHILITPLAFQRSNPDVSDALRRIKGTSARAANQLLARTGQPFWQPESYDHWVRNQSEFDRIQNYIEQNPVKAHLVAEPHHYRWSSAWRRLQPAVGLQSDDKDTDSLKKKVD